MWDKSPTLFADKVEKVAVKHLKTIGKDIIGSLVDQSPIDTSNFVSSHNVAIGQPDWSYSHTKLLGDRGSESQGLSTIGSMTNLQDLWFTNATPYGGELEGGKSPQKPYHPAGVVYGSVFLFTAQMYKGQVMKQLMFMLIDYCLMKIIERTDNKDKDNE